MKKSDFTHLTSGPYGERWSYAYDPETDSAPSVAAVAKLLGVDLETESIDASDEREDGRAEEVYFASDFASEYRNTVSTYRVQ